MGCSGSHEAAASDQPKQPVVARNECGGVAVCGCRPRRSTACILTSPDSEMRAGERTDTTAGSLMRLPRWSRRMTRT